jgi:signal transduction histidine kinase
MMIATQTLARQKESLSTQQRKLVEMTVEETARMNQLADNLMNLARGDIPSIPTQRVRLELGKLITETARRFAIQAQQKHVSLETHIEGTPVINADRIKLSWVISNLIGNALRYTPEGGKIEVAARAGENNFLRLEVADTGPGIPPEIRDHVFERYAQYSTPGYEPGSAGLGLAIVKDIVEAHGGRISIESNNGIGTRFIVQLPAFQEV